MKALLADGEKVKVGSDVAGGEQASGPRRWARGGTARTRAVLLDAAARVFAERGYDGASVDEIATAAGVSVGSIYSRFGNKQGLFAALMQRFLDSDVTLAEDALAGGLHEALQRMDERLRERADSRQQTLLEAETWVTAMRATEPREALAAHDAAARAAAARLSRQERERSGARWVLADEEIATALLALYHGLIRQRRLDPASVAPDLYGRLVLLLHNGMRAPESGD